MMLFVAVVNNQLKSKVIFLCSVSMTAGQVEDKSASANHGAAQVDLELVNVTSLGRRGLRLNGAGGIHVPHSTSLDLKGDLTIEIWVKPDALDTGYVTLKKSCFGYPQFKNANQATGFIYVGNRALTDNFMFATHASGGGADYYVMVVEGSRVSYYLNIMTVQGEDFTGQTPRGTSSEPLLIGESADLNGANKFFKGVLFGLRISKIARTYNDLKAMYKTGKDRDRVKYTFKQVKICDIPFNMLIFSATWLNVD